MLKEKIQEQINDIKDPLLFMAYQSEGHAIERHVLSDDELRRALWVKPRPKDIDDVVMVTRFQSKEKALQIIANTLQNNIDAIEKWLLSDTEKELTTSFVFDEPTGDGLVKNSDWTKPIPVHSVKVIIRKNFKLIGRSFVIVTAYPARSQSDVDTIYDAIDEFIAKKRISKI